MFWLKVEPQSTFNKPQVKRSEWQRLNLHNLQQPGLSLQTCRGFPPAPSASQLSCGIIQCSSNHTSCMGWDIQNSKNLHDHYGVLNLGTLCIIFIVTSVLQGQGQQLFSLVHFSTVTHQSVWFKDCHSTATYNTQLYPSQVPILTTIICIILWFKN